MSNVFDMCIKYTIIISKYLGISFDVARVSNKIDQLTKLLYNCIDSGDAMKLGLSYCFEYTTSIFIRFFACLPLNKITNVNQMKLNLLQITESINSKCIIL